MKVFFFFIILLVLAMIGGLGMSYGTELFSANEQAIAAQLQSRLLAARLLERVALQAIAHWEYAHEIRLVFVGDIMLARGVGSGMARRDDYRYPFARIASTTQAADIAFGNLESVISDRGSNQGSIYSFRAEPRAVEGLAFAGFDILSLANNHAMDWGRAALEDTIARVRGATIEPIGAGINADSANAPKIVVSRNTRFAFLGYTPLLPQSFAATTGTVGLSRFIMADIAAAIKESRDKADLVIVSLHWGEEYQQEPSEEQRRLARTLVELGADLIVGHHPHVVQPVESIHTASGRDGWVAYSLGNFVFDQNFSKETMEGTMLDVRVKHGQIVGIAPVALTLTSTFQPFVSETMVVQ